MTANVSLPVFYKMLFWYLGMRLEHLLSCCFIWADLEGFSSWYIIIKMAVLSNALNILFCTLLLLGAKTTNSFKILSISNWLLVIRKEEEFL